MPRRVDPRWGEDGFPERDPVSLTEEQVKELAGMLGLSTDPSRIDELRSGVDEIGTRYRNWHRRGASAFTREEARKALEELVQMSRVDYSALTSLNERAFQCVHDSLVMMSPAPVFDGDSVFGALLQDRFDDEVLRTAVRDGIDRLKATKGPDREGDIPWAVAELCKLYEDLTGRMATHSNKGARLRYESGSRSEAGRFVRACFRLIAPQVRDTQMSQGMRLYVQARK